MPSTFSFTALAPEPGNQPARPAPTCTTPGTVSGMICEVSPGSPELLRRCAVGRQFDDLLARQRRFTAGVSVWITVADTSLTVTSVVAAATSNRRSWRTVRKAATGNTTVSNVLNPGASADQFVVTRPASSGTNTRPPDWSRFDLAGGHSCVLIQRHTRRVRDRRLAGIQRYSCYRSKRAIAQSKKT